MLVLLRTMNNIICRRSFFRKKKKDIHSILEIYNKDMNISIKKKTTDNLSIHTCSK